MLCWSKRISLVKRNSSHMQFYCSPQRNGTYVSRFTQLFKTDSRNKGFVVLWRTGDGDLLRSLSISNVESLKIKE